MRVRGPSNVGRSVQTRGSNIVCYASLITEQKKCWDLLAQTFDRFQICATIPNNTKQHVTG